MDTTRKHVYGLKALLVISLAAAAIFAATALPHQAFANTLQGQALSTQSTVDKTVKVGDFEIILYFDNGSKTASSIHISKYTGNASEITIPSSFVYDGITYPQSKSSELAITSGVFSGNTKLKKVSIPGKYVTVLDNAFNGCTGLTEVSIGAGVQYIGQNAFANCPSLKTYYVNGASVDYMNDCGIGTNAVGTTYANVTVHTTTNSNTVINYVNSVNAANSNKINLVYDSDPYSQRTVSVPDAPISGFSTGSTEKQADAAAAKHSGESDPAGTIYNVLAAKITTVKKNSLTLQWNKAKGASKYVIYGNKCGKKNKLVKQCTVTNKAKKVISKVNKKAVKKGTYYKFIVVAFNSKGKVISTSKTVHAATAGGKVGNHKSVKAAKSISIKKGATKSLGAKPVAQSKKLKVAKHRGIAYESSNTGVATVSSKGVVKGMNKGTCVVYAYAQNGVCKKVKVTVS